MTSFKSPSHLVTELVTEEGRQWMNGFESDAMTTAFPILITQITFFQDSVYAQYYTVEPRQASKPHRVNPKLTLT